MRHNLQLFACLFFLIANSLCAQNVVINEFMASNSKTISDENGDYEDWIELYNPGNSPVNLEGYGLSDDPNTPFKWIFPNITIAPTSYLIIWASDKDRKNPNSPLHSNFKIATNGERLSLTHPNGTVVDTIAEISVPTDVSYGRGSGGSFNQYFFYYTPTPNTTNNTQGLTEPIADLSFSHTSGFFNSNITLSISHPNPHAVIVYTLDGSEPDITNLNGTSYRYKNIYPAGPFLNNSFTSSTYTTPLLLEDKSNQPNKISTISSTISTTPPYYFPNVLINKANVVKAKVYVNGIAGSTTSHSYFINTNNRFNHSLPVVSITVNENELFDYNDGIYVAGIDNFEENGISRCGFFNWNRSTELRGNFEYFVNGISVVNQQVGVRLHGGCGRVFPKKSLRIYARSEYGKSTLDYPFFEDYNFSSFKRLILRNSGNDNNSTFLRDAFMQQLVAHLNFETQQYQPVVHYINGEYWGIVNIRERYDRHYLERKFGIKEGEIDLIENEGNVEEGDDLHWNAFKGHISSSDMSTDENYEIAKTFIDEKSFIDYQISNIFIRNTDWPGNNVRYFRKKTSYTPNAPLGNDGRWRWMMYDTDFGFGLIGNETRFNHNTLEFATQAGGTSWPNPDWSTLVLRKLLTNNQFKEEFITRYADLLNTAFLPQRAIGLITEMKGVIESEIPTDQKRWTNVIENWQDSIKVMVEFANQRPKIATQHIISKFNLSGSYELTVNVANIITQPVAAYQNPFGYIKLNSINLTNETPGVSSNTYPWTGTYFNDIPVTLTAIANPGYVFSHWSGAINNSESTITITLNSNSQVMAHFVPDSQPSPSEVIHFWLMGNHIPNDTPLSTLTATFTKTNQLGVLNFESALIGYPFQNGHPNWRKASMERRNSPTPLNYFPEANNNLAFGNFTMRGLQIKQPFSDSGNQNTLVFNASTRGYQHIKLSFAVLDEGAADGITIEYLDGASNTWTSSNVPIATATINDTYQTITFDFTNVTAANNNPNFQARLRFTGSNMTVDEGKRVTFNNVAFTGSPLPSPDLPFITSTTPASRCDAGTVTLRATSNGGTITWYNVPEGGLALATGESFTTPTLSANTTYFVDAIGNQGLTQVRTPVLATVVDDIKPIIQAKSEITIQLDSEGRATLTWEDIDTGSTDNCGITERSLSKTQFTREDNQEHTVTYTIMDARGNSATTDIVVKVDIILSTPLVNPEGPSQVKLYPNPAKNILNLEFDRPLNPTQFTVEIMDASGRSIPVSGSFNYAGNQLRLDTSGLSNGMHFIKISSEASVQIMKFVIMK